MFVAAGLFFVVRALMQGLDDGAFDNLSGAWMAATIVSAAVAMTYIATQWSSAVRLMGGTLPVGRAVALYYQGEIGKYLPGAVWAVVGRGELAVRSGVARGVAYASVAGSLAGLYLAAALSAAVLLPFAAGARGTTAVLGVLVFLVVGVIGLHPAVVGCGVRTVERLARRELGVTVPSWAEAVRLVAGYLPSWLAIGAAHWCAARGLGFSPGFAHVVFASAVSWSAGFLAIPAPGGIGVRESVFVLTSGMAASDAAAAALVARVAFIAADGVGAAIGALVMTRRSP